MIQSPGNSQSLNPYSYIMNNPLAGTDPTGYSAKEPDDKEKVAVTGSRIKREATGGGIQSAGGSRVDVSMTGVGGAGNGATPQGKMTQQSSQASDLNKHSNQAFEDALASGTVSDYFSDTYGAGGISSSDGIGMLGQIVNWSDSVNAPEYTFGASSLGGVLGLSKDLHLNPGRGAFLALQVLGSTLGDFKLSLQPASGAISLGVPFVGNFVAALSGYAGFGISTLETLNSFDKGLITSSERNGKIAVDFAAMRLASGSLPGVIAGAVYGGADLFYPSPKGVPGIISLKRDVVNST